MALFRGSGGLDVVFGEEDEEVFVELIVLFEECSDEAGDFVEVGDGEGVEVLVFLCYFMGVQQTLDY